MHDQGKLIVKHLFSPYKHKRTQPPTDLHQNGYTAGEARVCIRLWLESDSLMSTTRRHSLSSVPSMFTSTKRFADGLWDVTVCAQTAARFSDCLQRPEENKFCLGPFHTYIQSYIWNKAPNVCTEPHQPHFHLQSWRQVEKKTEDCRAWTQMQMFSSGYFQHPALQYSFNLFTVTLIDTSF